MTSTPQSDSRSETPSPSPQFGHRVALRSQSGSSLHDPVITPRIVPQTMLTSLPPRLHVASTTPTTSSSPVSSIMNVEMNEGILLRDTTEDEGDVAENEETAEGVFAPSNGDDDERKKSLRDQLRRTLSSREADLTLRPTRRKRKSIDIKEITLSEGASYPQRQYFVITDAGKPVFVSRPRAADEDLTSIAGITSALISVFADNTLSPPPSPSPSADKLRCINAGSTRITFLLRPPLYYVCVSKWKEPESVSRMHLEYLHLQILSVITASQLRRIFERRTNFDLRRLLEGTESFLHILISRLQLSLAFCATLSALSSIRLDPTLRNRAGDALVPSFKSGKLDILYAVLISGDDIITLVRPKKHSVHPVDLHMLFNALQNPSISATSACWLPICLPKFNPQGFVHAYVSFLEHEESLAVGSSPLSENEASSLVSCATGGVNILQASSTPTGDGHSDNAPSDLQSVSATFSTVNESHSIRSAISESNSEAGTVLQLEERSEKQFNSADFLAPRNGLTLVVVSGGGEFDAVRRWSDCISKKLETTGLKSLLQAAAKVAPYTCSELAVPGLRHFLYKSRIHVQITYPIWDEEYRSMDTRRRLITLYQTLHDSIHAKSGQESPLKLQYIRTDKETVMGWVTQPFELYIALSPRLPKSAVVGAANAVARWVKREESKLFLRDAPIF